MRSKDVDPVKCPRLHAALVRQEEREQADWKRVVELRRRGEDGAAARLTRRILGVKGEPMTEEQKEERKKYNEEHKEERKEKARQKREVRARTLALLATGNKGRKKV